MIRQHIVGEYNCPLRINGQLVRGRLLLRYEVTELPPNGRGQPLEMSKLKHYLHESVLDPPADAAHVVKIYPAGSREYPPVEWVEAVEYIDGAAPATNVVRFPRGEAVQGSEDLLQIA